jgi:uncharacterized surface protein with fasciclin (FAS1) repeats
MKKLVLIPAIFAMFLAVSCGPAGNTGAQKETTTAEDNEKSAEIVVSDDPSQQDVVQVAVGSSDHTTLVAAVKAAELVEPLQKSGPYTVFAPTNAAFDKLPAGTVDGLMKPDQKDVLADILEYHVSVGVFNEDMISDGQKIGQVNSQNITISKKDGKIKVNGTANIIGSIRASNGIIYVIDEVLLPPKN